MELVALVVGALIGIFIGQIAYSKRLKKRYAGTLVMIRSDDGGRPDIYVAWNDEPSCFEQEKCVLLDVKVTDASSHN